MLRSEARNIIKKHIPSKYPTSTEMLLLKLVDLTYRKDSDDAERPITVTVSVTAKAARVRERQLKNILDQLSTDGILLDLKRTPKHISCRLGFAPISKLELYGEKRKAEKQERNDERTSKARESRAQMKEAQECASFVKQHFDVLAAENASRAEMFA